MRSVHRLRVVGLLAMLLPAAGAAWQPAKGPLATRWAKDVSPDKVHPEYPRPQLVRSLWLNLNGLWQCQTLDKAEAKPPQNYQQQILVPFPVESALSGVMQRTKHLWYRRTFELPAAWSQKRMLLHFGAVDWEATVWVNGKELGTHRGGYDGFSFDITDALRPAASRKSSSACSIPLPPAISRAASRSKTQAESSTRRRPGFGKRSGWSPFRPIGLTGSISRPTSIPRQCG